MNFIFNERSEHATLTVWKQINPESNERKSKNMIRTIGELRKAIEEIPDNYKLELSVDNGVDGKCADNGMCSNSPIRLNIWDEGKTVNLSRSEYTNRSKFSGRKDG